MFFTVYNRLAQRGTSICRPESLATGPVSWDWINVSDINVEACSDVMGQEKLRSARHNTETPQESGTYHQKSAPCAEVFTIS